MMKAKKYKIVDHIFVINGLGKPSSNIDLAKKLKELNANHSLRQIKLSYVDELTSFSFKNSIHSSSDVADIVRTILGDQIDVREHFVALFLNRANKVISYH